MSKSIFLKKHIEQALSYVPGDIVEFYSPDADRDFTGEVIDVDINIDLLGISLYYTIDVTDDGTVGKYYGRHLLTDDHIYYKI